MIGVRRGQWASARILLRHGGSVARGRRCPAPLRPDGGGGGDWRLFAAAAAPIPPPHQEDKAGANRHIPVRQPAAAAAATTVTAASASVQLWPGLALSAATAAGGFSLAAALASASAVPVSGIPVAILLGMALRNSPIAAGYKNNNSSGSGSTIFKPGIVFATKTILQGGIVCVAAKLSFFELLTAGTAGIPVVLTSVGAGLLFIPFAGRLAGLPKEMSLLLTAGTSICGVTAITALAPAINAPHRDIAVAVANTVAFGTIGMLTYPYLFHALCTSSEQAGMCLGVAIHDTSQVLGSALLYKETFGDEVAFKVAAVTKLMRNLGLAVAIPLLTYQHASSLRESKSPENAEPKKQEETISGLTAFTKYFPPFLIAFVGMTAFRSVGDLVLHDVAAYSQVMDFIGNDLSKYALGTAMAGVGLSTDKASLQGVGWKPFAVGLSGALVVGASGFTVAMLTV